MDIIDIIEYILIILILLSLLLAKYSHYMYRLYKSDERYLKRIMEEKDGKWVVKKGFENDLNLYINSHIQK